jgi:hypothetical protein
LGARCTASGADGPTPKHGCCTAELLQPAAASGLASWRAMPQSICQCCQVDCCGGLYSWAVGGGLYSWAVGGPLYAAVHLHTCVHAAGGYCCLLNICFLGLLVEAQKHCVWDLVCAFLQATCLARRHIISNAWPRHLAAATVCPRGCFTAMTVCGARL